MHTAWGLAKTFLGGIDCCRPLEGALPNFAESAILACSALVRTGAG